MANCETVTVRETYFGGLETCEDNSVGKPTDCGTNRLDLEKIEKNDQVADKSGGVIPEMILLRNFTVGGRGFFPKD